MKKTRWRNWARNQQCVPVDIVAPADEAELAEVISGAVRRGLPVKPVGAGHSFTPVALTSGILIRLDSLRGIIGVRPGPAGSGASVTVGAGTRLRELNRALAALGLALENLGDVDRQTIAGALATGTHGTGARLGGLASQVEALSLLTASGDVLRCDRDHHPEVFAAARVGLGALGVLSDVTLRCGPAFRLRAVERPARLAETVESFADRVAAHDHVEFYWFPHTDWVLTKINDRTEEDLPLSRLRYVLDDEVLANGGLRLINEIGRLRPGAIPAMNRLSGRALTARTYTAASYEVFTSPRRVRFVESEYAIPRAALAAVVGELGAWIDGHGERIAFPIEVRVAAADDSWLSTGYERENAYIAIHQFHRRDHRRYFAAFESIVAEHDGRPHWGKLHTLGAERIAALYPRHVDFVAARDRLDPARTFDNGYLRRVLG